MNLRVILLAALLTACSDSANPSPAAIEDCPELQQCAVGPCYADPDVCLIVICTERVDCVLRAVANHKFVLQSYGVANE